MLAGPVVNQNYSSKSLSFEPASEEVGATTAVVENDL
jgi:hypothetical protein